MELLLSNKDGDYNGAIEFTNKEALSSNFPLDINDLANIIKNIEGALYFDDWPIKILEFKILPNKKILYLKVTILK
jgi:hypothetical protein